MPGLAATSDYLDTGEGRRGFLRETSHELIREIGGGAYGRVWLARSVTGSYRAIKVVFRSDFKSDTPYDREYRGILKFEPISRDHDGFIDILHVGRNDQVGYFYYVMELGDDAEGESERPLNPETYLPRTLDSERRRHRRLPFDEALRLALKLTLALGALHKAGLVHRDIKPSNILLVGGQPKLADIGLVTDAGAEVSFVGTEGYIPPEGPGDPTADIYSLGKVLYEIITGNDRMQFPELPVELLEQSQSDNRFVEFNEILIKACDRNARNRYQSSEELHAHLALLQAGRSVKRLLELERMFQRIRRYLPVAAAVVAAAGAYFFLFLRERQREVVEQQRQVSMAVGYGSRAVESGDYLAGLSWFVEGLRLDSGDPYKERTHRLRIASLLQRSPSPVQMWYFPHGHHVLHYAEFSSDNQHILTANQDGVSALYNIDTGRRVSAYVGGGKHRERASFSPDERSVIVSDNGSSTFSIWNLTTGMLERKIRSPYGEPKMPRFSPQGDRIAAGGFAVSDRRRGSRGVVWDALSGEELFTLPHSNHVVCAVFNPDGTRIATASYDGTAAVWDAQDGTLIRRFSHSSFKRNAMLEWVAFSPDGRKLASCANVDYKSAHVWDIESGLELFPPLMHRDGIGSIEFSPDGRFIVTASFDTTARIWDATTGKPIDPPLKHSGKVMYAKFSSDSKRIVTVCFDGFVTVWDLPLSLDNAPKLTSRIYSPDGLRYLVQSPTSLDFHDAVTHQLVGSITNPGVHRIPVRFDHKGEVAVTFSEIAEPNVADFLGVQSWRVRERTTNGPLIRTGLDFTNAVVSADGRHLVLMSRRRGECWDLKTGQPLGAFGLATGTAKVTFDQSGNRLALGQHEKADVLDVRSGRSLLKTRLQHPPKMKISMLDFSPDGRHLVVAFTSGSFDRGAAQIWNLSTAQPAGPPLKHRDGVNSARFSPDGRHVVTSSEDYHAIVWDARTSAPLSVPSFHHDDQLFTATFTDDSRWLLTGGHDKTVRIWECESGEPLGLPFKFPGAVTNARLVAGGRQLYVTTLNGKDWLLDLPEEKRSVEDLKIVAELLSARRATRTSSGVLQIEDVIWESWNRFSTNEASKRVQANQPGSNPNSLQGN